LRPPNVFAGPYLDRVARLRKDEAYLQGALRQPDTILVPVWRHRSLLRQEAGRVCAALLSADHAIRARVADGELILLGQFRGRACFALELAAADSPELGSGEAFEDLRLAGGLLEPDEAGLLAYARAMVYWRKRHRYCGSCGSPTVSAAAGHVLRCSDPECGAEHFPRLDPAIIVLVTDGARALLGRQASWPEGRYSTIAGFVEPGESLEDAVLREVMEETGVEVTRASYHSSQPWPFPSSLMVGFIAETNPGSQPRADEELEDVRWFTREEIASGHPGLPPPQSVSFRLIEEWYDSASEVPLRRTPGVRLWGR
jgi:NAD+ diphosphatase